MRFLILLFIAIIPYSTFSADSQKIFTVVYTASLNGNIDSCTCKSSPKGGLVKRGTVLQNLRAEKKEIFLFDTGDYLPSYVDEDIPYYIFKSYEYLSYDALAFGDQDLDPGADKFLKLTKNLPFVNSNVIFKKNKTSIPLFRIIKKGDVTAAVIAVQDPAAYRYALASTKKAVAFRDTVKAISSALAAIRKDPVDITILLVHGSVSFAREIEKSTAGIDLIICGHDQEFLKDPVKGQNTVIVHPGGNGARIGVMDMSVDNDGVKILSHAFIHPDWKTPDDDPYIRKLITEYRDKKE